MHLSAFDVIQHLAKRQNPRQAFSNLVEIVSEVVLGEDNLSNLSDFTFPGPGQRPTPIVNLRQAVLQKEWIRAGQSCLDLIHGLLEGSLQPIIPIVVLAT
mgnify:CR=1 FL=1